MAGKYIITADSKPVYDEWGWDSSYWQCSEWQEWFYALKKKYGKDKAIKVWSDAWNKQTNFASPIDCRSFNPTFIAFLKKEDLWDLSTAGIGGVVAKTINIGTTLGEGAELSAKVIKYAVPVAFVLAFIGVSAYIYKKYIK